ncbi:MAG: GNAT family N-acetyltransferase [Candidatus Eremiobacteraeota bacterium]|nr:GNAT family N-acetyltransferase [Candidatus Eremiobacteraeota bacterium]
METIERATTRHAQALAPLFDAYRQFFTKKENVAESLRFVQERLENDDSVFFIGSIDEHVCGFAQLYPIFSSWYAKRIWFLSDLYVTPSARGRGIARRIIERVKAFAKETGAASVMVELPKVEPHLYRFYERLGFHQDKVFDLARYYPDV